MGKLQVCVYAICKNEAKFARRWMESMQEADRVVVLDTGSTDDTVEILRSLGAEVATAVINPWRFDDARNRSLALVPEDTDICVCTDLDEVFRPGWRKALEEHWRPTTGRARYRYTWNFNEDGSEGFVFYADKIHARTGFRWVHPVHEVLYSDAPFETITVPGIQLSHHADNKKSRAQYLPLLELAVREKPEDDRNMHYLGREYMFRGRYEDAIRTLKHHLTMPTAKWQDERCASMRYIAKCYVALGNRPEAERWLLRACGEGAHLREPFLETARFYYEASSWDAVAAFTLRALSITERTETYITDAASYGALPYDLLSLAYYYTGRFEQAKEAIEKACALSPKDERLLKNKEIISAK